VAYSGAEGFFFFFFALSMHSGWRWVEYVMVPAYGIMARRSEVEALFSVS
jgi:hypothetical protein